MKSVRLPMARRQALETARLNSDRLDGETRQVIKVLTTEQALKAQRIVREAGKQ